jgi:hypothetical protein
LVEGIGVLRKTTSRKIVVALRAFGKREEEEELSGWSWFLEDGCFACYAGDLAR